MCVYVCVRVCVCVCVSVSHKREGEKPLEGLRSDGPPDGALSAAEGDERARHEKSVPTEAECVNICLWMCVCVFGCGCVCVCARVCVWRWCLCGSIMPEEGLIQK